MAALICTKPGRRPPLIYRIHLDRGPAKGRRKGFTETDYARLLDAAHQQLGGPVVLVWDCEDGVIPFGTAVSPGLALTIVSGVLVCRPRSRAGVRRRRVDGCVPIGASRPAPSQS
ncbi:hypothetical protein ACFRFU_23230 [Streptomyces sp. NPDC056704]|uniref:hypothetical protein n=1 Tax=Streptomyces sp. NPDC056704 TaxID=3345917 RepID=UPI0036D1C6B2